MMRLSVELDRLSFLSLLQSGIDLYKVQCLLGHKSPIMTQRYAHHYPESLREGVEMLEKYRRRAQGAQI